MAATTTPLRKGAELGSGTVWLFPSASMVGKVYIVAWVQEAKPGLIDGHWCCSCKATTMCWHLRDAMQTRGGAA
jgi:hypothetical protein